MGIYYSYKNKERDRMERHQGSERDNKRKKDMSEVVGFDFDVLRPNLTDATNQLLPEDMQYTLAHVTLRNLKRGDVVSLNGVLGLENRSGDAGADVLIKIYKGTDAFIDGQEIYSSDFDIDTRDDEVVAPISHVDVIDDDDDDEVTYTLTVTAEDPNIFLIGPKTFTGLQIRKG